MKPYLNLDLVGPDNDEWDRIEAANAVLIEVLETAVAEHGYRLWWSSGDSFSWRLIIGIPSEEDLRNFINSGAKDAAVSWVGLIANVVRLDPAFKLYIEVDSDERVNAEEGWFFRVKSDPQPDRELIFVWNGSSLIHA